MCRVPAHLKTGFSLTTKEHKGLESFKKSAPTPALHQAHDLHKQIEAQVSVTACPQGKSVAKFVETEKQQSLR
jgi:hypothetical protein